MRHCLSLAKAPNSLRPSRFYNLVRSVISLKFRIYHRIVESNIVFICYSCSKLPDIRCISEYHYMQDILIQIS